MGWGAQQWMQITAETTYGTFATGGAKLYPTLDKPNAFSMRVVPQRQIIRTADGGNRRKFVVASRSVCTGVLNTLMHPDQAAYWATALTPASNALPSYTLDYWDSVRANRYLGAIISDFTITASATADFVPVSITWTAQKRDATFTTFSAPAESSYSTLPPFAFIEAPATSSSVAARSRTIRV